MKRIAILRAEKLPGFVDPNAPDIDELFAEDVMLRDGFAAEGFDAVCLPWSQTDADWNQFDAAVIRSTWDYLERPEQFLEVLSHINASACRLFNPLTAVRWNINKRYLFELEQWGIPIVPTYLASDLEPRSSAHLVKAWRGAVVKPTVGLAGSHSYRVGVEEIGGTLATLRKSAPGFQFLVQPFIESVVSEGEWSYIYLNRRLTHVLLKRPAPDDFRVQSIYGGSVARVEPARSDLAQAESAMAKLPFDTLYARLDFVRVDGRLAVIEAELIEPVLYFGLVPEAIPKFVRATAAALG